MVGRSPPGANTHQPAEDLLGQTDTLAPNVGR
jgi:hypothetical protein